MVSLKGVDTDWAKDPRFGGKVYSVVYDSKEIGVLWKSDGEYVFSKHTTANTKLTASLLGEIADLMRERNLDDAIYKDA